jgi:hypothetical protein
VRSGVMTMAQATARMIATNATVYGLKRIGRSPTCNAHPSDQIPQTRIDGKANPDMSIGAQVFD